MSDKPRDDKRRATRRETARLIRETKRIESWCTRAQRFLLANHRGVQADARLLASMGRRYLV